MFRCVVIMSLLCSLSAAFNIFDQLSDFGISKDDIEEGLQNLVAPLIISDSSENQTDIGSSNNETESEVTNNSTNNPSLMLRFPFQVSFQRMRRHFCGGAVLSRRKILTAAHCVFGMTKLDLPYLRIRAGSQLWNRGGTLANISRIDIHPNYDKLTLHNNLAVLTLSSPLVYSPVIQKVNISHTVPYDGQYCVATGWGTQYAGASRLPYLLRASVLKFIRRSACTQSPFNYSENHILFGMACATAAGIDAAGINMACLGDSGGPLVKMSTGELVGITSWGVSCALFDYPGVFVNVVDYIPFIMAHL